MLRRMRSRAIALGLGAAALFGLSVPLVKLAAGRIGTLTLAGLLYLGAGNEDRLQPLQVSWGWRPDRDKIARPLACCGRAAC